MINYFPDKFIAATTEYTTHEKHVPAPYFRKKFHFTKGKKAEIRICGLGFYELYINGINVTKGRLAPYITNPDEALYYDDYDVTQHLIGGENVIGVWLGNGMQNNPYGDVWDFEKAAFRSAPKFALAFYEDGAVAFESDESFVTKPSPIVFDDLRAGEHYDARKEIKNWNTLDIDDSDWQNAISAITPTGEKKVVEAEPILVHQEIPPVSVTKTPSGKYLYDFGVIFTGVCRLKIKGERGQEIQLMHGEVVINGELDMRNVSFERFNGQRNLYNQCDRYILKGEGEEIYTPRFTYHGFQYVEVCGITDEQATLNLLTFEIMHSAVQKRGDFHCSDAVANAIQESTQRSDLSNLFYVPTDCPHREKNGWTGDVSLSAEQMLVNFAVENTFEDWLFSVRNAQDDRGAIPGIVPTGGWGFEWGAGPNWDDVLFEVPYQIYRYTGNEKAIKDNFAAMKTYLGYMETKKNEDGLFCYGLGDWAQPKTNYQFTTPTEITDSIKCVDMCEKAVKMAKLVGDEKMAEYAEGLANEIRASFKKKYIQNGKMTVEEQTAVAYTLYYGIAKESETSLKQQLLELIEKEGVFATGVLGARVLFRVLSDMGQGNLAYKLIVQNKFPSYGYNVMRGARTLLERFFEVKDGVWEQKNGNKHDSLNHHFWGDVSAWFILRVAGIQINPDFYHPDQVEIAPDFIDDLTFAQGNIEHRKGEIFSRWDRMDENSVKLTVVLPQGVEASLRLPGGYVCDKQTLCAGQQEILVTKQ